MRVWFFFFYLHLTHNAQYNSWFLGSTLKISGQRFIIIIIILCMKYKTYEIRHKMCYLGSVYKQKYDGAYHNNIACYNIFQKTKGI